MRARDLMISPVHTVRDDDSVADLAALLAAQRISGVPVLDGDGALVGLAGQPLDDPDRRRRDSRPVQDGKVSEIMRPPVFVAPDADIADIARVLLDGCLPSVPVLDRGQLVGVVGCRELLHSLVRTDGSVRREVQARLDAYTGGEVRWAAQVAGGVVYLTGEGVDDTEETIVTVLARTVPGVVRVEYGRPTGERATCG